VLNAWPILALLLLALVAAATTGVLLLFNVAYLLAGVLVLGFLWSRASLAWLDLRVDVAGTRFQVGDQLVQRVTLRNRSVLPKLWIAVVDDSTLPGHAPGRVADLPPYATRSWTVRTRLHQRGLYRLGPFALRSADPFGCFAARRHVATAREVLVLPATEPLPDLHLPSRDLPGGARTRAASFSSSAQASSIRDYVPGDPVNRVHWRSTARLGRLIVKEVEHEPTADVWLALDLDAAVQAGSGLASTEEHAVTTAASIARRFLEAGRAVGLAMQGDRHLLLQPDRGERQLERVLEELALVRARGTLPFAELLLSDAMRPDRNAALVAITPSLDPAWPEALQLAAQRGARAVAVLVEPSTFGAAASSLHVVSQLAAAAVPTYMVKRGEPLGESLRTP
jgi:uncharacterized protein (DUF58 family)